jgi:hypothetical protein
MRDVDSLAHGRRFTDHHEIRLGIEQARQPVAEQHMVIDQQEP